MDPFGSNPQLDPENEILRNNVDGEGHGRHLEVEIIPRMVENTSRIHAAFLFAAEGKAALKQLCLRLCSTRASMHYEGWEDFGINLGLSSIDIKYIANHNNRHDEAYTVLQVFAQRRDSTLDKIILALKNINRFDIIIKVGKLLEELSDNAVMRYGSTEEIQGIIRPSIVPEPVRVRESEVLPLALQDLRGTVDVTSVTRENAERVENERWRTNANIASGEIVQNYINERAEENIYKKKVMLTFANDGIEEAKEVVEIFRRTTNDDRIGVVTLNEHTALVNSDPEDFICSAFSQVDFVVPIVTIGYLNAISTSNSEHEENSLLSLDQKYSKYIYALMNINYFHDGCKNKKVRCIIPDTLVHLIHQHPMFLTPLFFHSWCKRSQTEFVKENIIQSNI